MALVKSVFIDADGESFIGVFDSALDTIEGDKKIERASSLEFDNVKQEWVATFNDVTYSNKLKQVVLDWEISTVTDWLEDKIAKYEHIHPCR